MSNKHNHLIEPAELAAQLGQEYLILDLCSEQSYLSGHLPGAIHVNAAELMDGHSPAAGKLPEKERLDSLFSHLGITPGKTVIVYDNEGGGWAGRMAWTLDVIGHEEWLYLNGGLIAWSREGFPVETQPRQPASQPVNVTINHGPIANVEDILPNLGNSLFKVWDARSLEEFEGSKVLAQRGGHIPGAIHCEWTSLMDPARNYRIRQDAGQFLTDLGLTADATIVTHCQSHRRSSFTYMVARILGYPNIRGYHGSWSEWGNRPDTPVETGNG